MHHSGASSHLGRTGTSAFSPGRPHPFPALKSISIPRILLNPPRYRVFTANFLFLRRQRRERRPRFATFRVSAKTVVHMHDTHRVKQVEGRRSKVPDIATAWRPRSPGQHRVPRGFNPCHATPCGPLKPGGTLWDQRALDPMTVQHSEFDIRTSPVWLNLSVSDHT